MGSPVLAAQFLCALRGQLDGLLSDLCLRELALAGDGFDRMAIAIAGRKIHRAVNVSGVGAQDLLDDAQALHKFLPVHRAQETQAGDAVADRNLIRSLILAFHLDQLLDGQPLFHQPLLQPAAREMQHRALSRQALAELRHKRTGERKVGLRHVCHHDDQMRRIFLRHVLQPIHPGVRQVAILPREGEPGGDALEIFNQSQAQHDGDGPQFTQFQRARCLIGRDEGSQRLRIDLRIHVRDQFEHDVIDAGKSGGGAVEETRQFPAVAARQMPSGHLNLFLEQVEVVEQPFRSRGDVPGSVHGETGAVEVPQDVFVLTQPGEKSVFTLPRDHSMLGGEGFGMAGQLFDAEQLSPQRRLACVGTRTRVS